MTAKGFPWELLQWMWSEALTTRVIDHQKKNVNTQLLEIKILIQNQGYDGKTQNLKCVTVFLVEDAVLFGFPSCEQF